MSKVFYDHLIIYEEIETALTVHKLSPREKQDYSQIIEETIHHRVMTVILTKLPKEHHSVFLEKFHNAPYDESLMDFLKEKVEGMEEIIKKDLERLKKEFLEDLK